MKRLSDSEWHSVRVALQELADSLKRENDLTLEIGAELDAELPPPDNVPEPPESDASS